MFPTLGQWVLAAVIATGVRGIIWLITELINAPEVCEHYHWLPKGATVCPECQRMAEFRQAIGRRQ